MSEKSSTPDDAQPDEDATQPFAKPAGPDATAPIPVDDATAPYDRVDATAPYEPLGDGTEPFDPVADDATRPLPPAAGAAGAAGALGAAGATDPDATQVADAWTGRAEVRGPVPPPETQEWTDQEPEEPGRRWWLPILLGLLGVLVVIGGVAAAMMLTSSDDEPTPIPTPSRTAATTPSVSASPQPSPTLSSAPPTVAATVLVPPTDGDTQAIATGKLTALGLVVHVQFQEDPVATPGTVLGTVPTAGSEVPAGSEITIIVAKAMASSSPSPAASGPAPEESLSPAQGPSPGN